MANILDALGDLPSFFDQSKKTPGSLSYDELQMRRKIAMALASRRSPYPKTIGEGLSALGEGLADRWAMQDATKADAAYSAQDAAARRKLLDPEPDTVPGPPVAPVAPITPPPVAPQAAPPGVPPVAPGGGVPAPGLAPAPPLQRQPAPPPGPAIGALGGDPRAALAMSMTNAQPEGPVGMPSVPEGQPSIPLKLASLQPPTEPGPRPPVSTATVPASVPSTVPTGEMPVDEWKARVARIESGGQRDPYQALGQLSRRGDRAYGKYQVMGENIPSWTKEHLGQSMTPQEFLADPQAQEAVAAGQGQKYISKYGPEGAAKAWFAGPNGMNDPNRKDTLGTAVSEYARRFNLPLEGREQLARSLASPPPQDLASGEDARLADVTGQAAVQPRVQLASLRNEPTSDAAPEPMGGVAGAGIGQAADARREIAAAALAQQPPETMGLPAKVAQGPGPALPGATGPGPAPQQIAQAPPVQAPIQPAPEERPKPAGPEPTLQSVLAGEPRLRAKLEEARRTMADPRFTNSPTFTFAEKVFTDTRKELQDEYTRKWTRWHELDKGEEAFRLATEARQRARAGEGRAVETHSWAQQKAPGEIAKIYQDLRQSGETHEVAMRRAPIEYQKLVDEAQRAREAHAQAMAKGKQELITEAAPPPALGASPDPRLGTDQSPQRTGVPNVPPTPPGLSPKEWADKQTPELVKAVAASEKANVSFDDMIKTLRLARDHPGREWGVGATSSIARNTPGTDAYGFGKIMEQIGGKNFLVAYQQLKGGGAITEIEGTKAEAAQARLATAQNKTDFDKAMYDFEHAVRSDMETIQRKVNRPVTAWRDTDDNSSYAPDIGQRNKSGDKEYIGGNPGDAMSWKRVK